MAANRGNGAAAVAKSPRKRNPLRETAILEGALRVFGEHGFEGATISAIGKAAGVSDATLYEYFDSKEAILFAIAELYTRREVERLHELAHYIHSPRERLRAIIQAYLEFYEANPLYTSVALLTLKGNRRYVESSSYDIVRDAARTVVESVHAGIEQGMFRPELDAYLVRNMVLGFIEHLTIQWLLLGRPERLSDQRDTIFDMVIRAIEYAPDAGHVDVKLRINAAALRRLLEPGAE